VGFRFEPGPRTTSRAEYLAEKMHNGNYHRQHACVTVIYQAIEACIFSFQKPGVKPVAAHLIAARTVDHEPPVESPYSELS